jgi:poly-gamma-glutamate synthesis protein (capsule biosynthesis protein)
MKLKHWLHSVIFLSISLGLSAQDIDYENSLRIILAGDLMQHREQLSAAKNPATGAYDYDECFTYIQPILAQGDLTIGNLETVLAGTENEQYRGWPRFNSPDEFALSLKRAGFNLLVTANNHSADQFGYGINRTIDVLDSFDIDHVGTYKNEADRKEKFPYYYEDKGIKVAVLAYTDILNILPVPEPYVINRAFKDDIEADIAEAKAKGADFIMVYMHWGVEYKRYPSGTQRSLGEFIYDAGADFVIGSHPHVVQTIEKRGYLGPVKNNPGLVVYSLGNFISDFSGKNTQGGMLFELLLHKDPVSGDVSLESYGFIPTWVKRVEAESYTVLPVSEVETGRVTVSSLTDDDIDGLIQYGLDMRMHLETGSFEVQYELSDEIVAEFEESIQIKERRVTKPSLAHDPPLDADPLATTAVASIEEEAAVIGLPADVDAPAPDDLKNRRADEDIIGYNKKGYPVYEEEAAYVNMKDIEIKPTKVDLELMSSIGRNEAQQLMGKKLYFSAQHLYFAGFEPDAGVPAPKGYYDDYVVAKMPEDKSSGRVIYAELEKNKPKILDTLYRVQFMAANMKVEVNTATNAHLQGYKILQEDGYYKYVVGETGSLSEIKQVCGKVRSGGHKDAFVVMYVQGERIRNIFDIK